MPQILDQALLDPNLFVLERRKEYRLDIRMAISVSGINLKTSARFDVRSMTRNVTRNGACLELPSGLACVGSLLTLSIGKTFEAKSRVAWMEATPNGTDVLGVEFVSVTGKWVLYDFQ